MPKNRRPSPSLRSADVPARTARVARFKRPSWLRLPGWSRHGWRLFVAALYVGVSVLLLAAGAVGSYATDDAYWLLLLGIALPGALVFPLAAWYAVLSSASALRRVRVLRFERWPRVLRGIPHLLVGYFAGAAALLLWYTNDTANLPVGPFILAVMLTTVSVYDIVQVRRNRAAARK